ncbi:MAG: MMPL family transporter [Byssovorax sp.]
MSTEPSASHEPSSPPLEIQPSSTGLLHRIFVAIVARRWLVLAFYALVLPPAAFYAAKVGQDNSIDRLIVPSDPDFIANQDFQKSFGSGEYAVLLAEADDPFAPAVLGRLDKLETAVKAVPHVETNSALSIYRRAKAGFNLDNPEEVAAFRKFVTGTEMTKRQGLAGKDFLAIAVILDVHGRDERAQTLGAIDQAIAASGGSGPPLKALRKVGQPYVNVYLDESTQKWGAVGFGLFTLLVIVLNVSLYRSIRALIAFLVTLGVCMAVSVGYIGLTGGNFTIVSPMVPMTILITATATLVYIHSRFVDRPAESSVDDHQIFTLTNKFVACTASIFATLVGFAALAVSTIRPIRQMGIWVAVGLTATWVIVFTLFPALQKVLKTPTGQEKGVAAPWFLHLTAALPRWTYRFRYLLVLGSLALSAVGAGLLFGVPGVVSPMKLLVNPVEYINQKDPLYTDTKRIEQILPGLSITEVWLSLPTKGSSASISDPEILDGLHLLQEKLEADPDVGAAIDVTGLLRMVGYAAGEGDGWPKDKDALDQLGQTLEGLVKEEPTVRRFVNRSLTQTHMAVVSRVVEHEDFQRLDGKIRSIWTSVVAERPALKPFEMKVVGLGPLQAKMSQNLVPTLVESFGLTVVIIFSTFLVVFRSGAARLMAMVPSLFAILVMFGTMRITGMMLNVSTILIASTVLGTSENDQIHFFYHFLEKRKHGTVEEALRHTLRVSGKAILFATLINAGGFLAFAVAELPPMRQFGLLSALALVLSMIADFTALPAALWIVFREKPDPRPDDG